MLFNEIVNEWGEVTYEPTMLGNVLLAVVIIALIVVAAVIGKKKVADAGMGKKLTAKQIAFCAMSIALATILSNIKLFHFPTGGSVTLLSMFVVTLPGFFFGPVAGIVTAVSYGVFRMIINPYILFPAQLVVDYLLAFGALGLSGFFSNAKNGLIKGYIAGVLGRFVFSVISGWIFFGSYAWEGWGALPYSIVYNAIYMFSEAILTVIVLLIPAVKNAVYRVKDMANS